MTTDLLKSGMVAFIAFVSMGACQMVDGDMDDDPQQAVLANGEPETIEALKTALASAVGRSQIELGPSDPTTSSVIMVPAAAASSDRDSFDCYANRIQAHAQGWGVYRDQRRVGRRICA